MRLRTSNNDTLIPDRRHERYDQFYRGLRIVGGDLTRQTAIDGTVSMLGMLHSGLTLGITPAFSVADATQKIGEAVGGTLVGGIPELVVLPLSDGYHLAYEAKRLTPRSCFTSSSMPRQARCSRNTAPSRMTWARAPGHGDVKKLSTTQEAAGSSPTTGSDRPRSPPTTPQGISHARCSS